VCTCFKPVSLSCTGFTPHLPLSRLQPFDARSLDVDFRHSFILSLVIRHYTAHSTQYSPVHTPHSRLSLAVQSCIRQWTALQRADAQATTLSQQHSQLLKPLELQEAQLGVPAAGVTQPVLPRPAVPLPDSGGFGGSGGLDATQDHRPWWHQNSAQPQQQQHKRRLTFVTT
jgi:hypothetical protein